MNKLEQEGKQNIISALNNNDLPDLCNDCELLKLNINIKTQKCTTYCPYDNCLYDEKLGNNAEIEPNYPDDDPFDDYHSSMQCHLNQIGEKNI
jgi:hypothetical protein